MREHLHPEKFEFQLNEPLPAKSAVEHMMRIKERGAKVVFREPKWFTDLEGDINPPKMFFLFIQQLPCES
jgi:hypothetical protein